MTQWLLHKKVLFGVFLELSGESNRFCSYHTTSDALSHGVIEHDVNFDHDTH